jgi:hypothetical protein
MKSALKKSDVRTWTEIIWLREREVASIFEKDNEPLRCIKRG